MYSFLNKYGQLLAFVIGALLVIIHFVTGGDFGIYVARFLGYAAFILMIGFVIWSIIKNPKGSIPLIAGIGGILLLFLIFRGMASSEITASMNKYSVTAGQGKFVGGGIRLATILLFGAFLLALVAEVRGLFK